MRGARITIACECGGVHYAEYGERWTCPKCGRRYDTNQIPADEYWGIMREMRGYRIQAIVVALLVGAGFAVIAIPMGARAMLLLPVVMGGWFFFYMPRWRRKVRLRSRSLPRWQLHPE